MSAFMYPFYMVKIERENEVDQRMGLDVVEPHQTEQWGLLHSFIRGGAFSAAAAKLKMSEWAIEK